MSFVSFFFWSRIRPRLTTLFCTLFAPGIVPHHLVVLHGISILKEYMFSCFIKCHSVCVCLTLSSWHYFQAIVYGRNTNYLSDIVPATKHHTRWHATSVCPVTGDGSSDHVVMGVHCKVTTLFFVINIWKLSKYPASHHTFIQYFYRTLIIFSELVITIMIVKCCTCFSLLPYFQMGKSKH